MVEWQLPKLQVAGSNPVSRSKLFFVMGHAPDSADPRNRAQVTVVAAHTRVTGEITGRPPVRIEGALHGKVRVEGMVEVAAGAEVEAEVSGEVVRVAGTVRGNITAVRLVELLASACVTGDIHAPSLHVVEGARLQGRIVMQDAATPSQPAA